MFAVDAMRFGSGGADGAWDELGYDVDGWQHPTPIGAGHCVPREGAKPARVLTDGKGGIDNAFARNVMPVLLPLLDDISGAMNAAIGAGQGTVVLHVEALGPASSYGGLTVRGLGVVGSTDAKGAKLAVTEWATYAWRPVGEQLGPGDSWPSRPPFGHAYLANDVLVATGGEVWLVMGPPGSPLRLRLRKATIAGRIAPGRAKITEGRISGVLSADELVSALVHEPIGPSAGLCPAGGVLDQVRDAADMMADGTQDPQKICDGISIGLAFTAVRSALGETAPALDATCAQ